MENPSVSKSLTRSRSPIPRIKHMFSLRLQSAPPIHNLPGDLVVEIGRHISSRVDILSLSLVVFYSGCSQWKSYECRLSVQGRTVSVDV